MHFFSFQVYTVYNLNIYIGSKFTLQWRMEFHFKNIQANTVSLLVDRSDSCYNKTCFNVGNDRWWY